MEFTNLKTIVVSIIYLTAIGGSVFFVGFVLFPFFSNLSPEKRLEKFIDNRCLEGNEIAIQIRRQNIRYFGVRDFKLVRAAIEGNKHAIRALRLQDVDSQQDKR